MNDENLPEVEPPLPDNLVDRLQELHRRNEERGLTKLEQAIVIHDLRQFNEAMKPLAETMTEAMSEVAENITEAMQPLAEVMDGVEYHE